MGSGCGSGNCSGKCKNGGGGCGKTSMTTVHDWLSDITDTLEERFNIYEVSFKNGASRGFYTNADNLDVYVNDEVVVEASMGFNIGKIVLSGELVKLQMKRRKVKEDTEFPKILRIANEDELKLRDEARAKEKETMLKARIMARELNLDMKLGDVEYQADCKKATFYYTATQRVDFRELIKVLAKEFKVKIEMRQIGARQEAARVGGISSSGRELCSTTFMAQLKSVNTSAARYQNLSINQTKLSGQCGRLKCCLNFELDTYLDALKDFPDNADYIDTDAGKAHLLKTDILKGLMIYTLPDDHNFYSIPINNVKEALNLNKQGKRPASISDLTIAEENTEAEEYVEVVGQISLKNLEESDRGKKGKKRKKKTKPSKDDTNDKSQQVTISKQNTNNKVRQNTDRKQENGSPQSIGNQQQNSNRKKETSPSPQQNKETSQNKPRNDRNRKKKKKNNPDNSPGKN
ncbi:MAG: hypothetical protein M9887_11760 [Chitinophagales bacterium]|nr:hypothetical protein [Chitinophagales bacterium]